MWKLSVRVETEEDQSALWWRNTEFEYTCEGEEDAHTAQRLLLEIADYIPNTLVESEVEEL
jgi:hypothetical protein